MEKQIKFKAGTLSIDEFEYRFINSKPFSIVVVSREDFAGVKIIEEKRLKYSDWNYAFRFGGIGLLLIFLWNGIGYMINGLQGVVGNFFLYSSLIFAAVAGLGGYIIFFSIWDALFGSSITNRFLLRFFGKTVILLVIASRKNQHLSIPIDKDEKSKAQDLLN